MNDLCGELDEHGRLLFQMTIVRALTDSFGSEVPSVRFDRQHKLIEVSLPLLLLDVKERQTIDNGKDWHSFKSVITTLLFDVYLYIDSHHTIDDPGKIFGLLYLVV